MHKNHHVLVIDFGSQTSMLILRRIRELGLLAKIIEPRNAAAAIERDRPMAIVLSGGPDSLCDDQALRLDDNIFHLGIPILGICYGMQLIVDHFSGALVKAKEKEFGERQIDVMPSSQLFFGVPTSINVWMSHCDQVDVSTTSLLTIGSSSTCPHAAIEVPDQQIYGVQFHPEVSHTKYGEQILRNFVFRIAKATPSFTMTEFVDDAIQKIRDIVQKDHVVMGLSGGVDSSVAAMLIHRAIGPQLHCVYVNHGLHRLGEIEEVTSLFVDALQFDLQIVDAREQFFSALRGIVDPEEKRKAIGGTFVDVFEVFAKRFEGVKYLAQGTLYPDVIESSQDLSGPSHLIKSHHNVGGLPERMSLALLEPLRGLFKDEVKKLGRSLGLPDSVIMRQPFPGPGLAVRIPGVVTRARVEILQRADAIVRDCISDALANGDIAQPLWQWFAILLPIKSVGIMGDARNYADTIVIRCVDSVDAMTADWAKLPPRLLARMSSRITNEVAGVSRVLYDITQKPPGTIEWE